MKKPAVNFLVDSIAFFLFLCLLSTGFLIFFVIPPGSGYAVWGMGRHDWGDIHFWIAISFLMMMVIHVILHWKWIKIKIQGSSGDLHQTKKRSAYAIALFIIVLLLLMAPFLSPVEKSDTGHGRQDVHAEAIR
ncbi:MAG: DUF4405 domain-containing protein [Balneolaceae bacterium]|nr:DUF4405 domain-containing protein [Balneolaceae bacterium]MDR9409859.1 DUF4405 domain-containing protein [Balneolaceae bacterium]